MAKLDIKEKFLQTINKFKLLEPDEKILVMVSGGRDSIALLHLLYNNISTNLHIFHLNHLLRDNAQKDADFVSSQANSKGLKITSLKYGVKHFAEENKLSIQDAARKVRYRLAYETAQKNNINKIAFAHQLDDNVETFLYRLIKGAGPSGLKSIPIKRGPIVRPLLEISRNEITKYLNKSKIKFIEDPTNVKTIYARNKIRLEILPKIYEINPSFNKVLISTIDIIAQDDSYIEEQAVSVFNRCLSVPEIFDIDFCLFQSLSKPIQRRIIRLAISHIKGDLLGIESCHVFEIQNKSSHCNFRLDLPGNITVFREAGKLIFSNRSFLEPVSFKSKFLQIPGKTVLDELDLSILANKTAPIKVFDPKEPVVDFQKLKLPLTVRQWRDGDRFQPLGMTDKKKVHDFFIDKKIPRRLRKNIPIITDKEKIIWIAGFEIDNRVRLTKKTKEGLKLKLLNGNI